MINWGSLSGSITPSIEKTKKTDWGAEIGGVFKGLFMGKTPVSKDYIYLEPSATAQELPSIPIIPIAIGGAALLLILALKG